MQLKEWISSYTGSKKYIVVVHDEFGFYPIYTDNPSDYLNQDLDVILVKSL